MDGDDLCGQCIVATKGEHVERAIYIVCSSSQLGEVTHPEFVDVDEPGLEPEPPALELN